MLDLHGKVVKTLEVTGRDTVVRDATYWFEANRNAGLVEVDARHIDGPPSVYGYNGDYAFVLSPGEDGAGNYVETAPYLLMDFQPRSDGSTIRVLDTIAGSYLSRLLAPTHAWQRDLRGLFDASMDEGFERKTAPSYEIVDANRAGGPLLRIHYRVKQKDVLDGSKHSGWATVDPSRHWAVVEWKETYDGGSYGARIDYQTTPQGRPFPKRIYEYYADTEGTTFQEETIEFDAPAVSTLGEEGYQLTAYGIEPPAMETPRSVTSSSSRTSWLFAGVLIGVGVLCAIAAIIVRRRG